MSLDFKTADSILKEILEKSKDVDPDLRFMAINDLHKLLTTHQLIINKVNHYSKQIAQLLLEVLNDVNSDVQSQALRCFEPLTPSLDDNELASVLVSLNDQVQASHSATTSIHTIAILEILKNVNLKHASTGEEIAGKLISWNLTEDKSEIQNSLDAVETITEVIKNLGTTLSSDQKEFLAGALVKSVFHGQSIISKRAIAALGFLVTNLSTEEFKFLLELISPQREGNLDKVLSTLLTYISLAKANACSFEPYFNDIFSFAAKHLTLPASPVSEDDEDDEEDDDDGLDDDQQKSDDIRYQSLRLLTTLLSVGETLNQYIPTMLNIVKQYLKYDPYTNTDDDDEELEDFDDDFGDDYDELDEGSEDNSWKLRKQSADLISALVVDFPIYIGQIYSSGIFEQILKSIVDSSEAVTFAKLESLKTIIDITIKQHNQTTSRKRRGSDVSMSDVEDSLSQLIKYRTDIIKIITKELSSVSSNNLQKYNIFLNFFQIFNVLNEDLQSLLSSVRQHNFGLNLDLLNFYSILLENNDLQYFGDAELNYIIEIINGGLTGTSHISILNSIQTAVDLLNLKYNELLTSSIVAIIEKPKNDSELRNTAIESLAGLTELPTEKVNELLTLFTTTLRNENTALTSIHSVTKLASTYYSVIDPTIVAAIVEQYRVLLITQRFQSAAVESLVELTRHFTIDASISEPLHKLFDDKALQSSIVKILGHLKLSPSELQDIYLRASTLDEIDDEALVEVGVQIGSSLIPVLEQNVENQRNIKVMAAIILNEDLTDFIRKSEAELKAGQNPNYNVKLLGYIAQSSDVNVSLDDLTPFFGVENLKLYAAETLGNIISRNYQQYVGIFLEKIKAGDEMQLLLVAVKQVLKVNKALSEETYTEVWNTVVQILEQSPEIDEDICKISAQIIGYVLVNNKDTNYFFNAASQLLATSESKSVIYSVIASVKFILAYDNILSVELIESLLLQSFEKITDEDLKIKQIAIITLVTTLNNQFNLIVPYLETILPNVYSELKTRKQYEHVITIGPFKHRVDTAIEIRKNAFEILYKLSLNHSVLKNVDFGEILSNVVRAGIVADILSISSLIIVKLLEFDDVTLSNEDKQFLNEGIDKMLSQIKRKEDSQKETKDDQENKSLLINLRNIIFLQQ